MVVFSSTGTAVTHCPGTAAAPAANPGYACVYLGYSGGANEDVYALGTWAVTTSATTPIPRTSTGIGK